MWLPLRSPGRRVAAPPAGRAVAASQYSMTERDWNGPRSGFRRLPVTGSHAIASWRSRPASMRRFELSMLTVRHHRAPGRHEARAGQPVAAQPQTVVPPTVTAVRFEVNRGAKSLFSPRPPGIPPPSLARTNRIWPLATYDWDSARIGRRPLHCSHPSSSPADRWRAGGVPPTLATSGPSTRDAKGSVALESTNRVPRARYGASPPADARSVAWESTTALLWRAQ